MGSQCVYMMVLGDYNSKLQEPTGKKPSAFGCHHKSLVFSRWIGNLEIPGDRPEGYFAYLGLGHGEYSFR